MEQEAQQTQERYETPPLAFVEDPPTEPNKTTYTTKESPSPEFEGEDRVEKIFSPEKQSENKPANALTRAMRKAVLSRLEQNADLEGLSGAMNTIANSENGLSAEEIASWVQSFLEEKSSVLDIDQSQAETLSKEIVLVEQRLIEPLKLELSDNQAIKSVRESLYQLVIKGVISGEKICSLLTSIKFKEKPGDETGKNAQSFHGMSCAYIANGDSREIYIYGPFLSESKNAQLTIISHEIGHLLEMSTDLFDQNLYAKFQDFARNPTDDNIAEMEAENPQFAHLLRVIKEPTAHLPMWNAYIRKRLKKLETVTGAEDLARERVSISHELVAEMIGSYICSGESNESYFINQIKYSRPEDVIAYIKRLCGCEQDDQFMAFCQQNGLDLDSLRNDDPSQIVGELAKIPQLKIVFESSTLWREMIASHLSNRGEKLSPKVNSVYVSENTDAEGFIGIDGEFLAGSYSGLQQTHNEMPNQPGSDNAFEKIWDFLTGKSSERKIAEAK